MKRGLQLFLVVASLSTMAWSGYNGPPDRQPLNYLSLIYVLSTVAAALSSSWLIVTWDEKDGPPTLGGLREMSNYLEKQGFSLTVLMIDIYADGRRHSGSGRHIDLVEAVRKQGWNRQVLDVALSDNAQHRKIIFKRPPRGVPSFSSIVNGESGPDVAMETSGDFPFLQFVDENRTTILDIARWRRINPSLLYRIIHGLA